MKVKYDFNKEDIKRMTQNALADAFEALDNDGTVPDFVIKVGNHKIVVPGVAYAYDVIFDAIRECEEDYNL